MPHRSLHYLILAAILLLGFATYSAVLAQEPHRIFLPGLQNGEVMPSVEPSATSTNTPTPTPTATSTPTATATATSTPTNTATPTATATATSTPTATPTPTSTPTVALGNGITVLNNHSTHTSSHPDTLHVYGEIRNDSGTQAVLLDVSINFFDQQGQLVDTARTGTKLAVLNPGDHTCFNISLTAGPQWSYYEFETSYIESTYEYEAKPLTLVNHTTVHDASMYQIMGQVRNDGSNTISTPRIAGTIYDSFGRVVGCRGAVLNNNFLAGGQITSWRITFYNFSSDISDVASYRLQHD